VIQALLFDFDGVLVNSMPYHIEAWRRVFKPYGIEVEPRDVYLREGSKAIEIAKRILEKSGKKLTSEELNDLLTRKREVYQELTQATIYEGAPALIQKAKARGLKVGLVTGSVMENIGAVLDEDFRRQFDVIITAEEVVHGKPHPESYLKAAEQLGLKPEECLVIENAPMGIHSAKGAGMTVVAVLSTLAREDLHGADFFVADLQELGESFEETLQKLRVVSSGRPENAGLPGQGG